MKRNPTLRVLFDGMKIKGKATIMVRATKICAIACVMLAMMMGCRGDEEESSSPRGPRGPGGWGDREVTVTVETVDVERGEFIVEGQYAGEFRSDGMAQVSADVAGRIMRVEANIGDSVTEGQVLAKIDDTSIRQSVRELDAGVQMARANRQEAEANLAHLRSELNRRRPLLDRQMITEGEIEELENNVRRAEQQVAVAEATIEQNQARLTSARENLRNTEIRAPFDGLIGERYIDRGTYVSPGQTIFNIVDDGDIFVTVRLPERDAPRVHLDTPVEVRVGALGSAPLQGRIHRIAPALDPSTRSLRVDVVLDESEEVYIRPGMYARLNLELGRDPDALTITNQAILRRTDGTPYVWRVDEDNKAQRQELVLGLAGSQRTQIIDGLSEGDTVVFRGHEKLEDGTGIRDLRAGEQL